MYLFRSFETRVRGICGKIPIHPNVLTVARLLLIPAIIILYLNGWPQAATIAFIIAWVSDWIDGPIARAQGKETKSGELLDAFADKALFLTCLFFLFLGKLWIPVFWTLFAAEISLGLSRLVPTIVCFWKGLPLPNNQSGKMDKVKSGIEMSAIFLMMLDLRVEWFQVIINLSLTAALVMAFLGLIRRLVKDYLTSSPTTPH